MSISRAELNTGRDKQSNRRQWWAMMESHVCNEVKKKSSSQSMKIPSAPWPTPSHNSITLSFDVIFCSYKRLSLICKLLDSMSSSSVFVLRFIEINPYASLCFNLFAFHSFTASQLWSFQPV